MVLLIIINSTVTSRGLAWIQTFTTQGTSQHTTEYSFFTKKYSSQKYENK